MLITIKTAEKTSGDYGEFIKVEGVDGKGNKAFKNVPKKFEDKWGLLVPNATVEFKMTQKDNKWIIADILSVDIQTQPPTHESPRADLREKPEAVKDARSKEIETHVWWKELGSRIGDGSLDRDYPKSAVAIKGQYYEKMSEVTGVKFTPKGD